MNKNIITLCIICGISGCAGSTSHAIIGPNGSLAYRLTCHPDIAECLDEAVSLCSNDYTIISTSSHMGGTLLDLIPGPVVWYNVFIACQ